MLALRAQRVNSIDNHIGIGRLAALVTLALTVSAATIAEAETVTWTSDFDGEWSNGLNWSTGSPPSGVSDVVVNRATADPTITFAGLTASVHSLRSSESFVVTGKGDLGALLRLDAPSTIGGNLTFRCCRIVNHGQLDIGGLLSTNFIAIFEAYGGINAYGGVVVDGGRMTIGGRSTFVNHATTTIRGEWQGGAGIELVDGMVFSNPVGSVIEFQAHGGIWDLDRGAKPRLDNHGTIRVVGGDRPSVISVPVVSSGLIDVQAAGLYVGGAFTGDINVARGSSLALLDTRLEASSRLRASDGIVTFARAAIVAGQYDAAQTRIDNRGYQVSFVNPSSTLGDVFVDGGTVAFNTGRLFRLSSLTLAGTDAYSNTPLVDGVRTGTDAVEVLGLFTWRSGSLSGPATTHARGGMRLGSETPNSGFSRLVLHDNHTLENHAYAEWLGGYVMMSSGTTFLNHKGALFDIKTFASMRPAAADGGVPAFENFGVFRLSDSAGTIAPGLKPTTDIDVRFNNAGVVEIGHGSLRLNAGGESSGTFVIRGDGVIAFAGGHHLRSASFVAAPAGTITFSGERANIVEGSYDAKRTLALGGVTFRANETNLGNLEVYGGAQVSLGNESLALAQTVAVMGGTLVVDRGTRLRLAASSIYDQAFGTTIVNGSLESTSFRNTSGAVGGSGTIIGDVTNSQDIRPGDGASGAGLTSGIGLLSIVGDFDQSNYGAALRIDIAGRDAGFGHDVLAIEGHATFGGGLAISFADGFQPLAGDEFEIVTYAARRGSMYFYDVGWIERGFRVIPVYEENALILRVAAVPEPATQFTMGVGLAFLCALGALNRRHIWRVKPGNARQ